MIRPLCTLLALAGIALAQTAEQVKAGAEHVQPSGKFEAPVGAQPRFEILQKSLGLKPVGEHQYTIGRLWLDTQSRVIRLVVTTEQIDVDLEYALTHSSGKVHEALLTTDVLPSQLHYAAMLVGAKKGDPVKVKLSWKVFEDSYECFLQELISIKDNQAAEQLAGWVYTGEVSPTGFLNAHAEKSLVALINDPSALINRVGNSEVPQDDIYRYSTKLTLPKSGMPIQVELHFLEPDGRE